MSLWDWYHDAEEHFLDEDDDERLRLVELHREAMSLSEKDPDHALALLTEGRHLAGVLDEPWFAFFYDVWRVLAKITYQKDFRDALDLAVHCVVEARKPQFTQHPWRYAAHNVLIGTCVGIDPLGLHDRIQDACNWLETELPEGPGDHLYVMLGYLRDSAIARHAIDEGYALAQRSLALTDDDPDEQDRGWYLLGISCDLCWLCWQRGEWEELFEHAKLAEEIAGNIRERQLSLAEAFMWQAVYARHQGDDERARKRLRRALTRVKALESPPGENFYDAFACYHELAGNPDKALLARERQLKRISNRGQLAYECQVHIDRCRLRKQLDQLTAEHTDQARAAAAKLRKPEWYLEQIEAVSK